MLSDWALMKDGDGLILNYYGPSTLNTRVKPGLDVTLTQQTEYPLDGKISISVKSSRAAEIALKFRIPHWSGKTTVKVNGKAVRGVKPGRYLKIYRRWVSGDRIEVTLDMSLHAWQGAQECEGLSSVYRGPILLAYDHRYNLNRARGKPQVRDFEKWDPATCMLDIPPIDGKNMKPKRIAWSDWMPPQLLLEFKASGGRTFRLCDFGSAGESGTPYCSWIPVAHGPDAEMFSKENPLRSRQL